MVLSTNYCTMFESCKSVYDLTDLMNENYRELSEDVYINLIDTNFTIVNEASIKDIIDKIIKFITKWASNIYEAINKFLRGFSANLHATAEKIRAVQNAPSPDNFEKANLTIPDITNVHDIVSNNFKIIDSNEIHDTIDNMRTDNKSDILPFITSKMNDVTNNHTDLFNNYDGLFNLYFPMIKLTSSYMDLNSCIKMIKSINKLSDESADIATNAKQAASTTKRDLDSYRRKLEQNKNVDDFWFENTMKLYANLDRSIEKILSFNTKVVSHRLNIIKDVYDVVNLIVKVWSGPVD